MTIRRRKDEDTRISIIIAGEKKAFLYAIIDAIPMHPPTFRLVYNTSFLQIAEADVTELKLGRLK